MVVVTQARSSPPAAPRAASAAGPAPWPTLILVTAGLFLAVLSTTVVSVALHDGTVTGTP